MKQIDRRHFFRAFTLSITGLFLTRFVSAANKPATKAPAKPATKEVPPPAGLSPVSPTDAVAVALGYKPDVKDLDYAKYPQRKKPDAKNQFCKNCSLFTPVNESWGKCTMIVNGLVNANGWCGSYSKKV